MEVSEIKINETHICVLKSNGRELFVDLHPLKFEFNVELSELERMAENPNRSSFELEEYIDNGPLKVLLSYFNYCENLSRPYQGISSIKTTDYLTYKKKLDDYKTKIELDNKSYSTEQIQELINEYQKQEKQEVLSKVKARVIPYILDKTYKAFENQKEILAFSHRRVGWSFPKFKLSDDFEVIFKSNFGYGTASYFYTNIRYKEIDILPYSDWIRYRYAEKSEIIRYTRKHQLKNESWRMTMDFTSELFNYSEKSPNDFINKWIVNECIEMVDGLENLLNRNQNYEIINSFFFKDLRTTLMGIELINFKGERISGALSFLEKIKGLIVFSNTIPSLIERILNCNLSIYHELNVEINKLNQIIKELENQIDKIHPNWTKLKTEIDDFNIKKSQMLNEFKLSNPEVEITQDILTKIDNNFNDKYPRFLNCKKEFEPVDNEYRSFKRKLIIEQNWHKKFCGYIEVIELHFRSINRPLLNAQQG